MHTYSLEMNALNQEQITALYTANTSKLQQRPEKPGLVLICTWS